MTRGYPWPPDGWWDGGNGIGRIPHYIYHITYTVYIYTYIYYLLEMSWRFYGDIVGCIYCGIMYIQYTVYMYIHNQQKFVDSWYHGGYPQVRPTGITQMRFQNGISRYHDMKHLGRDTSKNSKESRLTLGCHCWCLSQLSWKSSPVGMEHYGTIINVPNHQPA